jgi:hypothetical protein
MYTTKGYVAATTDMFAANTRITASAHVSTAQARLVAYKSTGTLTTKLRSLLSVNPPSLLSLSSASTEKGAPSHRAFNAHETSQEGHNRLFRFDKNPTRTTSTALSPFTEAVADSETDSTDADSETDTTPLPCLSMGSTIPQLSAVNTVADADASNTNTDATQTHAKAVNMYFIF